MFEEYQSEIKKGEFFRKISGEERHFSRPNKQGSICDIELGEMVLVKEVTEKGNVKVIFEIRESGYSYWTFTFDDFRQYFEHIPNGFNAVQQEMFKLIGESSILAGEITDEGKKLAQTEKIFVPKQLPGLSDEPELPELDNQSLDEENIAGDGSESTDLSYSSSLIKAGGDSMMLDQAKVFISGVADRRNALSVKKKALERLQKQIKNLQELQKKWVEIMTQYKDFAAKLEEVINTLHLYLGTGEQILHLRTGKPSTADEQLVVRQLTLYMDEECALESESQGIDAYTIEEFDNWLLKDEKNLNQILPERKGIVALKPRRYSKEYTDDSIQNALLNEVNKETYILIRNGENIFRLCPLWKVGSKMFPSKSEFAKEFVRKRKVHYYETEELGIDTSDWTQREIDYGKEVEYIIQPGSDEYETMMDSITSENRYYGKALLMLQGLMDRTGIFPELQQLQINLMDIRIHDKHLRYIHDADYSKLLSTGKETFSQWHNRTTKDIGLGDRILGRWRELPCEERKYNSDRITPNGAETPDDEEIYVLEQRTDDGGFKFLYERTREVWSRNKGYHTPQTRAGCTIYPGRDDFILAYDKITLEDIEFWLNDRLSRKDYLKMFPLLKRVRNMKRIEREEEKPFITLIKNYIIQNHPVGDLTVKQLVREITDIVQWYKFKNKVHQSMSKDEDKAFRMIVEEWKRRKFTEYEHAKSDDELIAERLKKPSTLLIARRGTNIIRIDQANKDKIFVHRSDFYQTKKGFTKSGGKLWTIVGQEYHKWMVIWEREDWATWPKGARSKDFLNPDELAQFVKDNLQLASRKVEKHVHNYGGHSEAKVTSVNLCAVSVNDEKQVNYKFFVEFMKPGKDFPRSYPMYCKVTWKRTRDEGIIGEVVDYYDYGSNHGSNYYLSTKDDLEQPWDPSKQRNHGYFFDQAVYDRHEKLEKELKELKNKIYAKKRPIEEAQNKIVKFINSIREEEARQWYLSNFGDPLHWKDYKDKAKYETVGWDCFGEFEKNLMTLVENSIITAEDITGLTINEIELLVHSDKVPAKFRFEVTESVPEINPAEYVFIENKVEEEIEEEDED